MYLIDSGELASDSVTPEDLFNAYTGDGGLHGLSRDDFDNYTEYSKAKKEIENGQFFTPPALCEFVASCLQVSESDLVADLTCGMGNFFNFLPVESNLYGCELDIKAYKVAHFLYPKANLAHRDIRSYEPDIRFDYVVGNPPFHLRWWINDRTEMPSHLYYCRKAAEVLKPYGILSLIVPQSFLSDDFSDKAAISELETTYRFLGQISLPPNSFSQMGVADFPTKLQFWQRRPAGEEKSIQPYQAEPDGVLKTFTNLTVQAEAYHEKLLQQAGAELERNRSHIFLELARTRDTSADFRYRVRKLLYHIKSHPSTRERYTKCCEYLHRFYTEKQPHNTCPEKQCVPQGAFSPLEAVLHTSNLQ